MDWDAALLSDRGRWRGRNEDAGVVRSDKRLYVVADGMGGHVGGDVASRTAVERLDAAVAADAASMPADEVRDVLRGAIAAANESVLEAAEDTTDLRGMGTTVAAVIMLRQEPAAVVGHIGDSRAYRLHDGDLSMLTTDHTWVQDRVDSGELTPVEARAHPYANVLTRVLGLPDPGPADILIEEAVPGDTFLLCTDGLTGMLPDDALLEILSRPGRAATIAQSLVDAANAKGGLDNITVLVLRHT
jgi:protein phosphatase